MTSITTPRRCALRAGALLALLAAAPMPALSENAPTVAVSVTGVKAHSGYIMAALYDEAGWGAAPVDATRVAADGAVVALTLRAPAPGRYAIRLFHDVDGDGALDANLVGIPTEPFGFSNDAPASFGPPSFAAAAFEIGPGGASQTIALN